MSIATQITRLQGVRDQIRNKMVGLGLSSKTDLLQDLADDLDGVVARGDASATLSTSTRSKTLNAGYYTGGTIKIPNDYFPVNSTNTTATASDVLSGKKFVNTSGNTVTGNIATVGSSDVTASVTADISNITSINASQVTDGVTVTASASGSTVVPVGYYSTQVSKTPSSNKSTTIKPKLAGTSGAIELTAGTSAFTKKSTADYSDGFITSVKVNPTPSEEKTVTPLNTVQTVTPTAGKLLSKVTVNAIPSPYFNTSGVTATAGTVLKDYKFVNSSGTTVTGTIATATSSNVSGSVSGGNPGKITLTAASTSGSSSTTATASATVTKGLYTGSSDITKSLTSKTITATAEATLATSVTGSTTVPSTLPAGTVTITPNTDNTKRIYSDSTNKGFVTNIVLNAMDAGSYSASVASHDITNATASSSVTGSITSIASTTTPAGTDGTDYYTITPELTTKAGSSKAKGKATISTAGYLATGNTTSSESSIDVGVEASPGKSYYLKASSVTKEDPGTSYTNKATVTPSTSTQYVKVTAGYLPNSKIKVEAIPNQKTSDDVTATVTAGVSNITSINASQVTDGVTVTASASGSTVVPVGYYSTQVSKTPSDSTSTTIKPKLAGTSGAIELTAGTSAFTKTSTADYSNGFITSVKVNPTPSSTKEFTPTMAGDTVSPNPGELLSSVIVKGVPSFRLTLSSSIWKSDSNVTVGKYYYDVYSDIITDSNNLYVMPENGSVSAAQSFGVYAYSQIKTPWASTGTLQFRAIEKPTSDLAYTIYYLS